MKITKRQLNKIIMEELTSLLNLQEGFPSNKELEGAEERHQKDVKTGTGDSASPFDKFKKTDEGLQEQEAPDPDEAAWAAGMKKKGWKEVEKGKRWEKGGAHKNAPAVDEGLEASQLDERETSAGQARGDDRRGSHGRGQDEQLEEAGADRLRGGGAGRLASADVNVGLGSKPPAGLPLQAAPDDDPADTSAEEAADTKEKAGKASVRKKAPWIKDVEKFAGEVTNETFERTKALVKEALKSAMS